MMETTLGDIGPEALVHRDKVNEVKELIGIQHGYFDCWIFGFLENKKFDVKETVAKLQRRFAMEINELSTYDLTDYMRLSLRKGIIQYIGEDKEGRVTFYVTTKRDHPSSKFRAEQRKTFDMFVSYGTRLRKSNKRCQIAMLINQEGASMWSNVDMMFQAEVAFRISKYYPGGVDKMYICNMGRTLSAMAKPIFKRLPPIVSNRIIILDQSEIEKGVLFNMYDRSVLPKALGGDNDCDHPENWETYAKTIENYYLDMRSAVRDRGLSVKEWELEQIGINPETINSLATGHPLKSRIYHSRSLSNTSLSLKAKFGAPAKSFHSLDEEIRSMITCESVVITPRDLTMAIPGRRPFATTLSQNGGGVVVEVGVERGEGGGDDEEVSWAELVSGLDRHVAIFFLDELVRWRIEVEAQEAEERQKILESHTSTRLEKKHHIPEIDFADKRWYTNVPAPLRASYRLFLLGVTILCAIYFIGAIIFFACFTGDIIVTLFFGFNVKSPFIFPLGAVLMMSTIQGSALCSRAGDFLLAIYKNEVIPLFECLPHPYGAVAEIILFTAMFLLQLTIFCVYSASNSPLTALGVSLTTGWLSAVFIIAFLHIFFFTGLFTSDSRVQAQTGISHLPLYLAFDVGGDINQTERDIMLRTSPFLICIFPLLLSGLFGISFLISRITALYVCTMGTSIVGAFVVNYYSEAVLGSLGGSLIRATLWLSTVVWLYVCFTFGLRNYDTEWGIPVIISSVLSGLFVVISLYCLQKKSSNWVLRFTYIFLLLFLLGCCISTFVLVGWQLGVFCTALIVHNTITVVMSRGEVTGSHGVFFVSTAVLLLGIFCVLLGFYGTTDQYFSPHSLPSSAPLPTPSPLELFHRYPVCSLEIGNPQKPLRIADISLLTEVVSAKGDDVFKKDFDMWFSHTDIKYAGIVTEFASVESPWQMHRFDSDQANVTLFVLQNLYALNSVTTMIMWIDSIALSPLRVLAPDHFTATILYVMSFCSGMIPFQWGYLLESLVEFLNNSTKGDPHQKTVIVSAAGVAGGIAAAAGTISKTQTIVFSAPGLANIRQILDASMRDYHRYVISIGVANGMFGTIGGQDDTTEQFIYCEGNAKKCNNMGEVSSELLRACNFDGRRHV